MTRSLILALAVLAAGTVPAAAAPARARSAKSSAASPSAKPRARPAKRKPPARKRMRMRTGVVRSSIDATTTPAYRYAQLSADACEAELVRRGASFASEPARGVLAPVRLTGALRGVEYRTRLSETARETSPWEIADCRLVLALDDFAQILAQHDIIEVRHYSMWRPPRAAASPLPDGKPAAQHAGALALDAGQFLTRDGRVLDVDTDWHGRIGAKTCGPDARPRKRTPEALTLRAILCEAAAARLFNVILTPNHDRGHKNHFHLELTAGVTWFMVD